MILQILKKLILLLMILPAASTIAQTWQKQGKAAIEIVNQNGSCNSAVDAVGITADRSTLLTCQSGVWRLL
ncbi:MAG: hypothetical protein V4724_24005 [Pseudomonadota bacterium]